MKNKIMILICSLLLAMPVLSLAEEEKKLAPNASAYEHADENARFKRGWSWFNNKENKKIRAKRRAELAEKEAAEAKKKAAEAQDKGEGQVKLKF